jgi:SnoaL-like domain
LGHLTTEAKVTKRDSVTIVEQFWAEVWQRPQNPGAIDRFVTEDFVITSGGNDIVSRDAFKAWVIGFQSKVLDMDFEVIETFQNYDGSRVASRWRVTGRNNGIMGTEPNGAHIEMVGTAVWEVGEDGRLRHNWVERNAWEVHGAITSAGKTCVF